jgi:hypothetical protein
MRPFASGVLPNCQYGGTREDHWKSLALRATKFRIVLKISRGPSEETDMAYVYEVTLSNGKTCTVTVDAHHDHHTMENFKKILASAVQGAASGIANAGTAILIAKFVFKGKK